MHTPCREEDKVHTKIMSTGVRCISSSNETKAVKKIRLSVKLSEADLRCSVKQSEVASHEWIGKARAKSKEDKMRGMRGEE